MIAKFYLPTPTAAKRINVSPRTLEKWRTQGGGPPFHKFGGKVLYAEGDLEAWAAAQRRVSTSDGGEPNRGNVERLIEQTGPQTATARAGDQAGGRRERGCTERRKR
jgi:hypothetical protein